MQVLSSVFINDTVQVLRKAESQNDYGEIIYTTAIHIDALACSFQTRSKNYQIDNNIKVVRSDARLYCNVVDIVENDIVVYNSKQYKIQAVRNIFSHHFEIDLEVLNV